MYVRPSPGKLVGQSTRCDAPDVYVATQTVRMLLCRRPTTTTLSLRATARRRVGCAVDLVNCNTMVSLICGRRSL